MGVYVSKKKTKDGRAYFFKVQYYINGEEKPRMKVSKNYSSAEEASNAETLFLKKMERFKDCPIDMTFGELYIKFLDNRKPRVKFTTYQGYPNMYRYIKMFENLKCIDYDLEHYTQWKKKLYKNKKISLRYKNDILKFFKSILNYGTLMFNFDFNHIYRKMDKFNDPNAKKKEMLFYTLSEFNKFISVEDNLNYKCFFSMIYFCGLRCGEARGLQWSDLNFNNNIVSITKQVQIPPKDYEEDKPYLLMPPKTKTSNRRIPMCDRLVNLLKQYKDYLIDNNLYHSDSFVFGLNDGRLPISEYAVWRRKKRNCSLSKCKEIRLHDFRHSCASLLINNGANITVVANYLGHSEIEETLNTYSHMFPDALDGVIKVVNNLSNKESH